MKNSIRQHYFGWVSTALIVPSTLGVLVSMSTPTSAATYSADFSFSGVTGVILYDPIPGADPAEVFATHASTSVFVTSPQHGFNNTVFSPTTLGVRVVDGQVVDTELGASYLDGTDLYGLSIFAPPTGTVARLAGFLTLRSDGGTLQILESGTPTFGTPMIIPVDGGNGASPGTGSGNGIGSDNGTGSSNGSGSGNGTGFGSGNGSASNGSGVVDDLAPIPLPASLPLLLASLAGLMWLRSGSVRLRRRPA